MATNNFEQGLCDLLGEDMYRAFFTDYLKESDHTPDDDLPDEHAYELGGADYLDSVLLEASEQFERPGNLLTTPSAANHTANATRFAIPKSEEEVQQARKARIPKKTQTDTKYCLDIWKNWSIFRNSVVDTEQVNEDITALDNNGIQYWMSRFVLEVRKKDGSEYSPNTLHHICCGILRHLRESGRPDIDIFKDSSFADFRATLDGEMKRLQSLGIGAKKRQAEPLTEEEEERLWQTGQLGQHSPQALLDTMLFMHGVYFALRSGQEHRNLRFDPAQVELIESPGKRAYLRYTENISKNNPGGLKGRKYKPKVVIQHENLDNPDRCFVRLFRLYQSKCPDSRPKDAFYLRPLAKPTENCWYAPCAIGHHTLHNTVSRICTAASIRGFKTNHSLRVTAATRLFQAGVDEQLIMERTGHHSTDGIRVYKRSSIEQQQAISDILSRSSKKQKAENPMQDDTCTSLVPASASLSTQGQIDNAREAACSSVTQSNKQLFFHPECSHSMLALV